MPVLCCVYCCGPEVEVEIRNNDAQAVFLIFHIVSAILITLFENETLPKDIEFHYKSDVMLRECS